MESVADVVYWGRYLIPAFLLGERVKMARKLRLAYWLVTGALLGFGLLGILTIGLPFLLVGVVLVIFGAIRLGGSGLWAAVVSFGGIPALFLLYDITSAPWACLPAGGQVTTTTSSQTSGSYYTCVDTPVGPLTTYHILAIGFGIIALVGVAWPLLQQNFRRGAR
jgi:hypothetical protein